MREMKGLADVEFRIGRLSRDRTGSALDLCRFPWLRQCCLREAFSEDQVVSRLDLVVESSHLTPPCRLRIILWGAKSLRLNSVSVGSTITGLEIVDISDRQWESIHWELGDYENSMIRCYADEAEILLEPEEPSQGVDAGTGTE